MQENNLKEILQDVRSSYRLLYNYQKRMLDLIGYIGGKYGFTYNGGYPHFSNTAPRRGGGSLDNWAWDWLNMYYYEFNFGTRKIDNDSIHFSVFLVSDNGYYKAKEEGASSRSISSFKSIEDSESELILVTGKNLWLGWGKKWDESKFIIGEEGVKGEGDKIMFFKHYSLENFGNEKDTIKNLKEFAELSMSKGIPIKFTEHIIK